MDYLSIDFESRSTVKLPDTGVYPYAAHPTTSIICMAYAFGDGPVQVWRAGGPFPSRIVKWVRAGKPLRAHNAQFERVMWRDCLWQQLVSEGVTALQTGNWVPPDLIPIPDLDQWHCTAAEAAAMSLPRHLKGVAKVLNVDEQKDEGGHRLMLQMCKPRAVEDDGSIRWWDEEDPEKLERLIEYCKQDVRAERAVAKKLRRLGEKERQVYLLDQKINDRGVRLDVPLIRAAKDIVDEEMERVNEELAELTGGEVTKVTQVQRLNGWVNEHGADLDNLQKATIRDTLEEEDLPNDVERALEIRQEAGKSSNAKLDAMLRCRCEDDYARGLLLYHGAGTGRWSGKLIQPQNLPRPSVDNVEYYIPDVRAYAEDPTYPMFHPQPLEVISSMLRSMLIASPGHRLLSGDYSQIEARVTGWLGDEPFEDNAYEKMAGAIFDMPWQEVGEDSEERQVGKVAELLCGFQGGAERYKDTVKKWTGIEIDEETAEHAVNTYRERKSGIVQFWYDIEDAARDAVMHPGKVTSIGPIRYVVRNSFLWCVLPSSRPLAYALPKVQVQTTPWGSRKQAVTYCGINGYTRRWERMTTYGGHLTENVVQAIARDVMAEAMLRLEDAGYRPVLTVHDEIVGDVPEEYGSLEEFLGIMEEAPEWAEGLPIEVEGWEGERYRK